MIMNEFRLIRRKVHKNRKQLSQILVKCQIVIDLDINHKIRFDYT